jgi:hypothetical protein
LRSAEELLLSARSYLRNPITDRMAPIPTWSPVPSVAEFACITRRRAAAACESLSSAAAWAARRHNWGLSEGPEREGHAEISFATVH